MHATSPGRRPMLAVRMLALGAVACLPDIDLLLFFHHRYRGTPYAHRGCTHSLFTALAFGVACGAVAWIAARSKPTWFDGPRVALFVTLAMASHGLIDACSSRGGPVMLGWPLTNMRVLAPVRPIPVAHFDATFLATESLECLAFSPLLAFALWPRRRGRTDTER